MANTIDWVEIRTSNVKETADFYQSLFGWKLIQKELVEGSDVWILDTGGEPRVRNLRRAGIAFRPPGGPLGVVVYIAVKDIEETLSKVPDLGGSVLGSPSPLPDGTCAFLRDPCGNLIGVYQDAPGPQP